MGARVFSRSFSGGEITPELFGRLDLTKVQEALALCLNFITLPHGPAINRPGLQFVEEVKTSANPTRLIPFSYNNTQTFAIQLGAGYFRFHTQAATLQAGALPAYVPSAAVTISIASPAVVTWNAHGLAAGSPVSFATTGALPTGIVAGTTYYVANPTTNTFQLAQTAGGTPIGTSGTQSGTQTASYAYSTGNAVASGGVNYYCILPNANQAPPNATYWYPMPANGDYEIPNPYAVGDLMDIHYTQSADVMTLVHPNYPILELRRYGATSWVLVPVSFAPGISAPAVGGGAGNPVAHTYMVVAAWNTGTALSTIYTAPSGSASANNDLTQAGAYNMVSWAGVPYATSYLVYKVINGTNYYVGTAAGTSLRDDSSITYIQQNPPAATWPSAPPASLTITPFTGAVSAVTAAPTGTGTTSYSYQVTALDGSGNESYASAPGTCQNNLNTAGNYNTITFPAVAGAIRYNVYKLSYGIYGFIGQVAPSTSGAMSLVDNNITADISRTPPLIPANVLASSGNYPAAVTYYQQRRLFGGSTNAPQNIWATRSGTERDMSYTIPTRDDNSLAFRIAGREASAIRHIVPLQDLLFLSASCEWKCSSATGVLTPTTINVQPQSYIGANNVQPIVVGNAALYAAARGGHLRQINYNWQINGYQSTDSSIFAPHLFDYSTIVDMAYCRGPIPILWCVSSTGKLLGMTYLPEQQIASWHQHLTGATDAFESICVIAENNEDMLYAVVRRTINGATKRYIERLHTRLYSTQADAFYVDSGVTYDGNASGAIKNGTYTVSGTTVTCTITSHGLTNQQSYWFAFSDANYGSLPSGSKYQITVVDANTFTLVVPAQTSASGTVSYLPNIISGLTWLEGSTVNILADGAVMPAQAVTGGTITLSVGVSKAQIGLPITAQLQTPPVAQALDPAYLQGRAKNVNKVFLRAYRSSGVYAGPDFNNLVQYAQRGNEPYGTPPALVSDEIEIVLDNEWGMSGQVCVQQTDPLPLDLVSMTAEIAIGGGI